MQFLDAQWITRLAHQNRTIAIARNPAERMGFWAQKSQPEIANRQRLSIASLNRNAALLVSEIAAISGVRDGHRNRKSQKSLRFRCANKITRKICNDPKLKSPRFFGCM